MNILNLNFFRLLCIGKVFRIWRKYCFYLSNKNYSKINQIPCNIRLHLQNKQNKRKNIIKIYRALLLLKIAWKLWYKYSNRIKIQLKI